VHFFFYLFLCAPKEKDILGAGAESPATLFVNINTKMVFMQLIAAIK
jgi:hypothetical protein